VVVLLPGEHDLRRSVVTSGDVAGHLGVLDPGETKVADLEVAVLVYENVRWLEVSMNDASGVDKLEPSLEKGENEREGRERKDVRTRIVEGSVWIVEGGSTNEHLVGEVLDELVIERTGGEESVKIGSEELREEEMRG
jgi:hypothetical protein